MKTLLDFPEDNNISCCNAVSGNVNFEILVSVRFDHVSAFVRGPPISRACLKRRAALIECFPYGLL